MPRAEHIDLCIRVMDFFSVDGISFDDLAMDHLPSTLQALGSPPGMSLHFYWCLLGDWCQRQGSDEIERGAEACSGCMRLRGNYEETERLLNVVGWRKDLMKRRATRTTDNASSCRSRRRSSGSTGTAPATMQSFNSGERVVVDTLALGAVQPAARVSGSPALRQQQPTLAGGSHVVVGVALDAGHGERQKSHVMRPSAMIDGRPVGTSPSRSTTAKVITQPRTS
ncbi:hypothetical protein EJB05_14530, partial [Eragrostis curvula]